MIDKKRFQEILSNMESIEKIAVLGDVGVDKYTLGSVDRISPEAPVPVLSVEKEWVKLGLAANVSDNLLELNIDSALFGVIGEDEHANVFEDLLESRSLSTWGIVRSKKRMTTFKERIVAKTQQICRIDYETSNSLDDQSKTLLLDRLKEFGEDFGAIVLEDYAKGLFDEEFCREVIKYFNSINKVIAVDPSRTNPVNWYKNASLVKPNLKEARILMNQLGFTNTQTPEEMCKVFIDKLELENVVITLGEEGMVSMNKNDNKVTQIPTVAKAVYDVSGAGDTCVALLTSGLLAGASIHEASVIANLGAGVVVGKKGTATVKVQELVDAFEGLN